MDRHIAIVGAPSSIGIRPYDDGEVRHLNRAPDVLRERGLARRLDAIDFGDVVPPAYVDYHRPLHRARNQAEVFAYSRRLADTVAAATADGRFALVLGGDCSILLGCLLGAKRTAGAPIGLAYVDAHGDLATVDESTTGSAAGMSLAFAIGRDQTSLGRLGGRLPLVEGRHVALVGRRDDAFESQTALSASGILDLSCPAERSGGPSGPLHGEDISYLAAAAMARVAARDVRGFWIQLDVDVIDPVTMPAVDSPEPGGFSPDEVVRLLLPLVSHPRALGMSVTIYDPALDPDRSCARLLVNMLSSLLVRRRETASLAS